jgi:hypothetical protein
MTDPKTLLRQAQQRMFEKATWIAALVQKGHGERAAHIARLCNRGAHSAGEKADG